MSASARIAQRFALAPLLVVSLASLVLSWHGLTVLGMNAGLGSLSWLLPIVIDGLTISGALCVVVATTTKDGTRFGWSLLLGGALASIYGNVASADVLSPETFLAHSAGPFGLALSLEAFLRTVRREIRVTQETVAREAKKAAAREVASKPAVSAQDAPASVRKRKVAPVEAATISRLVEAVEALPSDASLTARARAVLDVEAVTGGVLAQVLNITPSQAYKARDRALRMKVA